MNNLLYPIISISMLYALTSESNAVLHNLENTCGSKHCRCDYELNLLQIRCGPSITNNNSSEFVIFRNTILDLVEYTNMNIGSEFIKAVTPYQINNLKLINCHVNFGNDIQDFDFKNIKEITFQKVTGLSEHFLIRHPFNKIDSATSLTILSTPLSLTTSMFISYTNLTTLKIWNSITAIEEHVFNGSRPLESLDIENNDLNFDKFKKLTRGLSSRRLIYSRGNDIVICRANLNELKLMTDVGFALHISACETSTTTARPSLPPVTARLETTTVVSEDSSHLWMMLFVGSVVVFALLHLVYYAVYRRAGRTTYVTNEAEPVAAMVALGDKVVPRVNPQPAGELLI